MVASAAPIDANDARLRDELIEGHLYLARRVARRFGARLPQFVDVEELESDGYLGLLRAAQTFDPDRRIPFRVYATKRILGQMLDGLRQRNQLRQHQLIAKFQSLTATVAFENGRSVTLGDTIADDSEPVGTRLELRDEVEFVLNRLSERSRQHLIDRYLKGHTQAEMARTWGISEAGVSQRMLRIRKWASELRRGRE